MCLKKNQSVFSRKHSMLNVNYVLNLNCLSFSTNLAGYQHTSKHDVNIHFVSANIRGLVWRLVDVSTFGCRLKLSLRNQFGTSFNFYNGFRFQLTINGHKCT